MMKFSKMRLEQLSDGVIAIILTIMVLNIPLPNKFGYDSIMSLLLSVLVFFISFFIVGFFWHQHYRLFHAVKEITSTASWRNLLFLFSLSLMPIFTKWVIENLGKVVPCIGYMIDFVLVNLSYQFMLISVMKNDDRFHDKRPTKKRAVAVACIWAAVIGGVITLSFFLPTVASILLIGLPLGFSVTNMLFEHHGSERKK